MIDAKAQFVKSDDPIVSMVDNEVVMLSVKEGAYFSFNGVGSEIWRLLETPISFEGICKALEGKYRVEAAVLGKEVADFLESIVERGLAHPVTAP